MPLDRRQFLAGAGRVSASAAFGAAFLGQRESPAAVPLVLESDPATPARDRKQHRLLQLPSPSTSEIRVGSSWP